MTLICGAMMKMRNSRIKLVKITSSKDPLLAQVPELYEKSFPEVARIDSQRLLALIDEHPEMTFNVITVDGEFAGMAVLWDLGRYRYFEYFAMVPSHRNSGIGAQVLKTLHQESDLPIVGEAEPPVSEMQKRRIAFYLRNGFHVELENPAILNGYHSDNILYLLSTKPIDDTDLCQQLILSKVYSVMHN